MFTVVKAGQFVAVATEPRFNVPEVRFNVPVDVTWKPPSLKTLPAFSSPMMSVGIVAVPVRVTPAELFILTVE